MDMKETEEAGVIGVCGWPALAREESEESAVEEGVAGSCGGGDMYQSWGVEVMLLIFVFARLYPSCCCCQLEKSYR